MLVHTMLVSLAVGASLASPLLPKVSLPDISEVDLQLQARDQAAGDSLTSTAISYNLPIELQLESLFETVFHGRVRPNPPPPLPSDDLTSQNHTTANTANTANITTANKVSIHNTADNVTTPNPASNSASTHTTNHSHTKRDENFEIWTKLFSNETRSTLTREELIVLEGMTLMQIVLETIEYFYKITEPNGVPALPTKLFIDTVYCIDDVLYDRGWIVSRTRRGGKCSKDYVAA